MPQLKIKKLEELKNWLENNWQTTESVWLIFPKKSFQKLQSKFAWSEIVDILLCYGWIDSLPRKIDENYTSIRISPQNPKSNWSKANKDKVAALTMQGLIYSSGQKMIDLAKQTGTWQALDDIDNLILPKDLEDYLLEKKLLDIWHAKSKSFKKGFLEQLLNIKKVETRLRKIKNLEL